MHLKQRESLVWDTESGKGNSSIVSKDDESFEVGSGAANLKSRDKSLMNKSGNKFSFGNRTRSVQPIKVTVNGKE